MGVNIEKGKMSKVCTKQNDYKEKVTIKDSLIPAVLYINTTPTSKGLPKGDQTQSKTKEHTK